jgi:hypothetical protein
MNTTKRFQIIRVIVFIALVALGFYFFQMKSKPTAVPIIAPAALPTAALPSGWVAYSGSDFSLQYPATYKTDTAYQYQALGPGKEISGVSMTIPADYTAGTNLSSDSKVSVEQLQGSTDCSAALFVSGNESPKSITENGLTYSYVTHTEPAAGNIYEEHVYAIVGSSPCTAIRYLLHSGNIHNYDPGAVQEFNKAKLLAEFDAIRATLVLKN